MVVSDITCVDPCIGVLLTKLWLSLTLPVSILAMGYCWRSCCCLWRYLYRPLQWGTIDQVVVVSDITCVDPGSGVLLTKLWLSLTLPVSTLAVGYYWRSCGCLWHYPCRPWQWDTIDEVMIVFDITCDDPGSGVLLTKLWLSLALPVSTLSWGSIDEVVVVSGITRVDPGSGVLLTKLWLSFTLPVSTMAAGVLLTKKWRSPLLSIQS